MYILRAKVQGICCKHECADAYCRLVVQKAERGRAVHRGGGVPRVSSAEHIPKKACVSRTGDWQDKQDGSFAGSHGKRKLAVEAS